MSNEVIRKKELIRRIAESTGSTQYRTAKIIDGLADELSKAMRDDERVSISELFTVENHLLEERRQYIPSTGEVRIIPKHRRIVFSSRLK